MKSVMCQELEPDPRLPQRPPSVHSSCIVKECECECHEGSPRVLAEALSDGSWGESPITLASLVSLAEAKGLPLGQVAVTYAECGSHAIDVVVLSEILRVGDG